MSESKQPGELIKEARERLSISQFSLAKELGLASGQSISNIERGVVALPVSYINAVCAALQIDHSMLIEALVLEYRGMLNQEVALGAQNRH